MRTDLQILWIGIGGAVGAVSRYGIALAANKFAGTGFPFGTLIANLIGCFLIGMLLGSGHADKNDSLRLGVGVGFLGALTTFSTFGAETLNQMNDGNWGIAFSNVIINVVLGVTLVFLGILAGKKLA